MIQKSRMKGQLVLIILLLSSRCALSQEINNYSTLFDVRDSSHVRISYDNDLFRFTDRYYSQGIGIDFYSWRLRKNPLNMMLLRLKQSDRDRFGIEFRTHGCTPSSITSSSLLNGDRPYAGIFSFAAARTSQQKERKLRLTSQFELGMIGPAALGEETQTLIHKITGDDLPLGWEFQINNSPIINYTVRIEKGPKFRLPKFLNADVYSQLKVGTFQTNASAGFEFSIGKLNTPYSRMDSRYAFYLYSQSSVTSVGYDASLMGGIIDRSGYHLPYSALNPVVFRQKAGFVFGTLHFSFGFEFAFISKEIKSLPSHGWGGVRLTFY